MDREGPGPIPEAWERNIINAEMPEEMLELYRQQNSMKIFLTPDLMKFQKALLSRRHRLDGKCDYATIMVTIDKTCLGCGIRDVAHT
eukprot:1105736-Karenia_brevis.AAC.1